MEPEKSVPPEQESSVEKDYTTFDTLNANRENADKLWRYSDALNTSIRSIMDDHDLTPDQKHQLMTQSLGEFDAAMQDLFSALCNIKPDNPPGSLEAQVIGKSDPDRYDEIVELEKFNPYHDRLGRFSTADGAASFTYKPGQGAMYDNAIAREKERDKQGLTPSSKTPAKPKAPKKEKKPSDPLNNPASIAGVERGDPMTRSQANNNRVNPNYFKAPGYQTNCQSCVVAYEARLRGYNVQTKANTRGSKLDELSRDTRLAWIDPATGKKPDWITNEKVTTAKRCKTWMEETIKPGERYTFQHGWKGRSRTGHIISADKDSDGNLRLYDPQNGKTMQGADIDAYLGRAKFVTTVYGTKIPRARLIRVDNMQFNPDMANSIMEAKKAV